MKGSILIYGGNKGKRKELVDQLLTKDLGFESLTNIPDILNIYPESAKRSIGIGQMRELIKYINQKPFSHYNKAAIIHGAEKLTVQAQNSILKTLEEVPHYASIILDSKTKTVLLKTVLSRCQKISATTLRLIPVEGKNNINEIISKKLGERITFAGEFSKEDQEKIIETLEHWILQLRNNLSYKNSANIRLISQVKSDLEYTNINTKLALEHLVLHLR